MKKEQLTAIHDLLFKIQELDRDQEGEIDSMISYWELWCRIDEISSTTNTQELGESIPYAMTLHYESGSIPAGELHKNIEETFKNN